MYEDSFKNSVPRAVIKTFLLVFAGLFLFGICYTIFDDLSATRKPPLESDLVGRYVPDEATKELLRSSGRCIQESCYIDLRNDHNYEMRGMLLEGFAADGVWKVIQYKSGNGWSFVLQEVMPNRHLNLHGQQPPYSFRIYIGDPDTNDYLKFVRQD